MSLAENDDLDCISCLTPLLQLARRRSTMPAILRIWLSFFYGR
jgi:hypothetical protein